MILSLLPESQHFIVTHRRDLHQNVLLKIMHVFDDFLDLLECWHQAQNLAARLHDPHHLLAKFRDAVFNLDRVSNRSGIQSFPQELRLRDVVQDGFI